MFTVLVAEQSIHHRHPAFEILKANFSEDCTLQQVGSYQEVLRFLETIDTDIIIFDTTLPGASSAELVRYLHSRNLKCIILPIAEFDTFDLDAQPSDPAIIDYLLKPFSDTELILTLEEALRLCRDQLSAKPVSSLPAGSGISKMDIVKKNIQQYIELHYGEILSMQDVARAMNYSDTHFCRLFKQCFQVNFSIYLNDFRVCKAMEMLTLSNMTVKDVGCTCGYRDTSYFIRVFKRHTGMTPSDYRLHKLTMTAKKYNKS